MYPVIVAVLVASLVGAQPVDDLGTGLLTPGGQSPYPPAQSPYSGAQTQSYTQYWDQQPAQAPQGFTVQSGYEGIIAPTGPASEGPSPLHKLGGLALGAGILHHLLPFPFNKLLWLVGSKLGLFVLGVSLVVLIGGAATSALCLFTPICTINFLGLRLNEESVRSVLSKDRMNSITKFIYNAFDKYEKLQERSGRSYAIKQENKGKKPKHPKENREEVKDNDKKSAKEAKEVKETTTESEAVTKQEEKTVNEEEVTVTNENNEVPK